MASQLQEILDEYTDQIPDQLYIDMSNAIKDVHENNQPTIIHVPDSNNMEVIYVYPSIKILAVSAFVFVGGCLIIFTGCK